MRGKKNSHYRDADALVICSHWQCPFPAKTNGLCKKHFATWYGRYGRKDRQRQEAE